MQVTLLGLDANSLASTVPEPTPADDAALRKLYDASKDIEYNPASPTPGFKEGTRLSLAWMRWPTEAPDYYRTKAANHVKLVQGRRRGGGRAAAGHRASTPSARCWPWPSIPRF